MHEVSVSSVYCGEEQGSLTHMFKLKVVDFLFPLRSLKLAGVFSFDHVIYYIVYLQSV